MSVYLLWAWLSALDAGTAPPRPPPPPPPAKTAALSPEDAEMLKHLDVLESLDEARDLDLLEELSVER